ncbi:MAG: pirin family protein [Verrucomicrobium sp.]|nr:pirin family protein [Verrucomicrobium sp.]
MITIRKSGERGHADHGWLDSRHTFSFADYFDPEHAGFRALRVINEDRVAPARGFGTHPHRDMEIISYVVDGALRHRDSMGNTAVMRRGEVQRISAGKGISHSELNDSAAEPVHFLQIWIVPDKKGVAPAYGEKSFAQAPAGRLHLAASKEGREGSLSLHQDVDLYVGRLEAGGRLRQPLAAGRHGWVQLIEGGLEVNGVHLEPGDAAALSGEAAAELAASGPAHFLFFDLN